MVVYLVQTVTVVVTAGFPSNCLMRHQTPIRKTEKNSAASLVRQSFGFSVFLSRYVYGVWGGGVNLDLLAISHFYHGESTNPPKA